MQVIASIIFVFFANVTPAVSFGGLLLTTTEKHLVRKEGSERWGSRGGGRESVVLLLSGDDACGLSIELKSCGGGRLGTHLG